MSKVFENIPEPDLAVLVGVNVSEEGLDELSALCESCNIREVARAVQNRERPDITYYIGSGKVEEVRDIVQSCGATVVVFDVELSGSKVRNLEQAFGVAVLDRSKVILDIFARRAQSMEGKLQVELAQLKYNLPRLSAGGLQGAAVLSKMKNSVGMRGPGEKKLELDKRTIRDQIAALEEKIARVSAHRELGKRRAHKSGKFRVCIVGYTNSGKSTLHNAMSKSGAIAEDKLFATLDPKTANVYLPDDSGVGMQILLTDTVGFVDKLPHEFIKAFESTLDEARYADVLLHVVDASNPNFKKQIEVVGQVLGKIGAAEIPSILVYNKVDKVREFADEDGVLISARKKQGIEELKEKIKEILAKQ